MELILNTYGVTLSRENNCFVINSKDGKQRIPTDGQYRYAANFRGEGKGVTWNTS